MATTCKSQGCAAGMSLHKRALTCLQPGQGRFVNATQAGQGKFLHQSGGPSFQGVKSLPCAAAKATAISQDSPPPKIFPRQNKGEPAAKSLTPPRSTGGSPLTSCGWDSPVAAVLSSRRSRDREERWARVGREKAWISPALPESQRRGVRERGQETRSSWQLAFVLAIPSPLRPGSSQYIQEHGPCQGKLYLTCALPDCLHSSQARHLGQGRLSPCNQGSATRTSGIAAPKGKRAEGQVPLPSSAGNKMPSCRLVGLHT